MNQTSKKVLKILGYIVLILTNLYMGFRAFTIFAIINASFFGESPTKFDQLAGLIALGELPIVLVAFYYLVRRKLARALILSVFALGYLFFTEYAVGKVLSLAF